MNHSTTLNPHDFPLWGSRLIEASAGTGKTWTIAALYLRLVLGHGGVDGEAGETGFLRPLLPSEILVMTFTRAATRELSDRIRARLLEAAKVFRGEAEPATGDALLRALLNDYPDGPARSAAAWRLGLAAESMDDAAVHTIDAWCQRMLREHAFDSGCLFNEDLIGDEQQLLLEATQDYWRAQVYPLGAQGLDQALAVFGRVDALAQDARQLLAQDLPLAADVAEPLGLVVERAELQHAAALATLKQGWAEAAERMQAWLDGQMEGKTCPFNKTKLRPGYYQPWLQSLRDWALDAAQVAPEISEAGLRRLSPAGLAEALKPDAAAPEVPSEFEAFANLLEALQALESVGTPMRLHAAACIGARLAELKAKSGLFGFADMLNRLDRALDPATQGASAERLRQGMLAQYPVALIDEFQDTSPLQARIFDRLYRLAENSRDTALLLIGDPKQSIYGFRGADIYSYLDARHKTAGRHYMLGTNHRSSLALVAAVNQVFARAEQREGEGAFMFRAPADASANPLPFAPVAARGRAEVFVSSQGPVPALSLQLDAQLRDANSSQRLFAARCAEQIAQLLNDEGAGFSDPARGSFERLRPADIAVLVRTGREAATLRRELRRRNIASVYLSDKDSVFASAEARDLLRVLQAVAEPLNMRLVRAALATRLLGLSLAELAHLAQDDEAFDARSDELKALQSVWLSQGVLAMLRELLHAFDLPAQWLAQDERGAKDADGERRLTNVLHLAELLQAASLEQGGEQALIRWLAAQIEEAEVPGAAAGEGAVLRLESDADLVKVVTVHKSKGLEYPLVFMPFAASFRAVDKARTRFVKQALPESQNGESQLYLEPTAEQIAQADRERLREDLRLLYVALTRARHALWLGVAALKVRNGKSCESWRSAIGYVLGGASRFSEDQLQELAEALAAANPEIAVQAAASASSLGPSLVMPRGAPTPLKEPQAYQAEFERRWGIGSFSALVRALPVRAVSTEVARSDEDQSAPELMPPQTQHQLPPEQSLLPPWHRFPRGAFAGNFLHDQLEWLAEEGFHRLAESSELQAQLMRRCERQGWGNWAADVLLWLQQVCAAPLPPVGCALQDLTGHLPEMEFWFPADHLNASALDALCRRHLLGAEPRPALPQRQLHGLLMGFADLVFEHQGRYFVLDYKSNHLGASDADYSEPALQSAMAQHRYDVQAALYLLALHRLLRARLGEAYQPEQHLGGAVYVFMRGMQGPAQGCYWVKPSEPMLNELDQLLDNKAELQAGGGVQ
ncbi:exodeoxyribonuclease V subunit beta [Paucibacter sp. AS339]|uniref:exodeoxyribonuclease V subunit beta n=1 Tax=Paucibacter hankyongi TaxID=3133434 RepID=UPI0030B22950